MPSRHTASATKSTSSTGRSSSQNRRLSSAPREGLAGGEATAGASPAWGAGSSKPRVESSSVSMDTPRASLRGSRFWVSGNVSSSSQRDTAWRDTPSRAASCSWVSPRPFRRAWIFCPVVMGTPPSSGYSIQELPVARNHSKVERAQPGVAFSSFLLAPAPGLWSFSAQTSTPRSSLGRW